MASYYVIKDENGSDVIIPFNKLKASFRAERDRTQLMSYIYVMSGDNKIMCYRTNRENIKEKVKK
jgi:hypothetical protein